MVDVVLDGLRERPHGHVAREGGGGRGVVAGLVAVAPLLLQVGVIPQQLISTWKDKDTPG